MTTTAPSPRPAGAEDARATVIRSATRYREAQAVVDRLSDGGFPVEHTTIVGRDVRLVERVTGRLTKGKAAGRGAVGGLWFGLLLGLLFGIFLPGGVWLLSMLAALAMGALWGAVFGFVQHWSTRGERDFASSNSIEAERYDVIVPSDLAARAEHVLSGVGSIPTAS